MATRIIFDDLKELREDPEDRLELELDGRPELKWDHLWMNGPRSIWLLAYFDADQDGWLVCREMPQPAFDVPEVIGGPYSDVIIAEVS